jgi:hypothetical protein
VVKKTINKTNEKTFIDITILIIFEIPIEEDCSDEVGSGGLNYPYDKKSECEVIEYQQCELDELNGLPETDRCEDLEEGFFDDCAGFPNAQECSRYYENPDCYDDPYSQQCTDYCSQNPGATGCPYPITASPTPELTPSPTPELTPTPSPTPEPTPTPNALARGLLPTTPSPTLDNPCEAIPEPDIPECRDLPSDTPEPTPLPPTPETLLDFPTEDIEEIPNVPLEDTEEEEVEEEEETEDETEEGEETEEESGGEETEEESGGEETEEESGGEETEEESG